MDASPSQNHTHRENRKTTALKCQITHYPLDPFKTVRNLENTKTHTLVSCLYQVFVQTSIPTFFATFSKVNATSVEYASPAPNRILLKSSHRNMKKQNHICGYCDICPTFQSKLTRLIVCIAPRQTLCSHRVRHACWFLLLMLMWRVQRALFLWIKAAPLMRSDKQATSLLRKSTLGWKSFVLIKF